MSSVCTIVDYCINSNQRYIINTKYFVQNFIYMLFLLCRGILNNVIYKKINLKTVNNLSC